MAHLKIPILLPKMTESEWQSKNPVLLEGEQGWESDSNRIKIGDGVSNWNDLPYATSGVGVTLKPWTPLVPVPRTVPTNGWPRNNLTILIEIETTVLGQTILDASANYLDRRFSLGTVNIDGDLKLRLSRGTARDESTVDITLGVHKYLIVRQSNNTTQVYVDDVQYITSPAYTITSWPALAGIGASNTGYPSTPNPATKFKVLSGVYTDFDTADSVTGANLIVDLFPQIVYPANATSNIFEITGTPTPLQWDELGGTVVDGDLVAFDSAGVPFVVDVSGGGGDVTAAGDNVLTGSNTFEQPIAANLQKEYENFLSAFISYIVSEGDENEHLHIGIAGVEKDNYTNANIVIRLYRDGRSNVEFIASDIDFSVDEIHGLESRAGTFPLKFDIERTYGSKETPLTGNLGWTKSINDKRVYQEVYHNDATAPTELASMTKVGDGLYVPSVTNLIYIWCSLPNATTTADGYFYTVTQV